MLSFKIHKDTCNLKDKKLINNHIIKKLILIKSITINKYFDSKNYLTI